MKISPLQGLGIAIAAGLVVLTLAVVPTWLSQRTGSNILAPTPSVTQLPATPALNDESSTICTMDAFECPDGSYVGRSGPSCEFVCPSSTTVPQPQGKLPGTWKTAQLNNLLVSYPETFEVRSTTPELVLSKQGPTQKMGTEVFDGMILNFRLVPRQSGQTLAEVAAQLIAETQVQGGELEKNPSPFSFGTTSGLVYTARGLGTFNHYLIEESPNSAQVLDVITVVEDPGQLGFQGELELILGTLQWLQ